MCVHLPFYIAGYEHIGYWGRSRPDKKKCSLWGNGHESIRRTRTMKNVMYAKDLRIRVSLKARRAGIFFEFSH